MAIHTSDVAPLTLMLSSERLGPLMALTGSAETAIELHQETLRLGSSLMNVIATIEIALRNSVCENLSHFFAVPNWLLQPPIWFQWRPPELQKVTAALDSARRAEYSKLTQAGKGALEPIAYPNGRPPNTSHAKRAKDRRKRVVVSEGKVIAEITLYFWKRLYGPDYEQTLWRTTLKKTFPNKSISRSEVAIQLEHIYQSRNRLAHHEPVLYKRFSDTIQAIEFIIQNFQTISPTASTPLTNLLREDIVDVSAKSAALHARLDSFRL